MLNAWVSSRAWFCLTLGFVCQFVFREAYLMTGSPTSQPPSQNAHALAVALFQQFVQAYRWAALGILLGR